MKNNLLNVLLVPPELSQGAQANYNGKLIEQILTPIFIQAGFPVYSESEYIKKNLDLDKVILTNVKYTTIYGENGRTEYLIISKNRKVRIECKNQFAAGSVDEKAPYTLINAIEAYPEKEAILLYNGDGFKAGMRKWIKDKLDNNWLNYQATKDIKLMDLNEFIQWFNREF